MHEMPHPMRAAPGLAQTLNPYRPLGLRDAGPDDVETINAVLEAAIESWGLPERVVRLTLPSLRYSAIDFATMRARITSDEDHAVGFACVETADPIDTPSGGYGLLLHGVYVMPGRQRGGIGTALVADAANRARKNGYDGLSVRAWRESEAFFRAAGFAPFGAADTYPRRMWLAT